MLLLIWIAAAAPQNLQQTRLAVDEQLQLSTKSNAALSGLIMDLARQGNPAEVIEAINKVRREAGLPAAKPGEGSDDSQMAGLAGMIEKHDQRYIQSSSIEHAGAKGARDSHSKAEDKVESDKAKIERLQSQLKAGYKTTDADQKLAWGWLQMNALKGDKSRNCVEKRVGEYKYEVCAFQQVKQDSTSLGRWTDSSLGVKSEEEARQWGAGYKMHFEHGQKCWNGPERSTTVHLRCSKKTEITSVVESSTCVYDIELDTPIVCNKAVARKLGIEIEESTTGVESDEL